MGGLGVGILNAADDLAGGGAALTRGARQVARGATRQASGLKLPPEVINNFRGGLFAETTLRKPLVVYRLYGGKAKQLGAWFMLNRPFGRLQATIDYAIRPEWGNTLERLVAVQLPRGTKIFVGPAAPQRGLVGGGVQVFVPQSVRPEWVLFDVEFP